MGVDTKKYIRKPLYVEAIRVNPKNFEDVAAWCDGEIHRETQGPRAGKSYIRVRVQYPKGERQTKAFVGDWVLYTASGYKVYTNPAFTKSFDAVEYNDEEVIANQQKEREERAATAEEIREALPHAQDRRPKPHSDQPVIDESSAGLEEVAETPHVVEEAEPVSVGPVAEDPDPTGTGVQPIQSVQPGDDLGTTPQGEPIEVVEATPEAIADVVNEQQPVTPLDEGVAVEESPTSPPVQLTPGATVGTTPEEPRLQTETGEEHKIKHEPVEPTIPAHAAAGKHVLSHEEQRRLGPEKVRELVSEGSAVLEQDLAESA